MPRAQNPTPPPPQPRIGEKKGTASQHVLASMAHAPVMCACLLRMAYDCQHCAQSPCPSQRAQTAVPRRLGGRGLMCRVERPTPCTTEAIVDATFDAHSLQRGQIGQPKPIENP